MTQDLNAKRDDEQIRAIEQLLEETSSSADAVKNVMTYLHEQRLDYHWVGIYVLKGDTLHLGPYVGPPTDHERISVGHGVCGTAVAENKNQIISDVRQLTNYLACNLETRSEIVVLIRQSGSDKILGQIDVDGTRVEAFGKSEETFLTSVAALLAPHVARL